MNGQCKKHIPLSVINEAVVERLGPTRVKGNRAPFAFNRHVAMYLAYVFGRWPLSAIGRYYNGRHHTTVLYGIQKIAARKVIDPDVEGLLQELVATIGTAEAKPRIVGAQLHPDAVLAIVNGLAAKLGAVDYVDLAGMCVQAQGGAA